MDRFPFTPFPRAGILRVKNAGGQAGQAWAVVGWRSADGDLCIAHAFCSHLGAKLTPDAGGSIRDSNLVCPFHGFTYASGTRSHAVRYSILPAASGLRRAAQAFAGENFDELGREPDWRLP